MMNQNQSVLLWLHEECLNPFSPALQAYPDAPRVFVFDDEASLQSSLKRLVFQYECLLEIPHIEIRKGRTVAQLTLAAQEHHCSHIITTAAVAPNFPSLCTQLQREAKLTLTVLAPEPFVELSATTAKQFDLKRFSRYWQVIKRQALTLNQPFDW